MAISNADGSIILTTKVDDSGIKKWFESVKNGNPGLKKVEYIIIHDENGQYTEEVKKNFKRYMT